HADDGLTSGPQAAFPLQETANGGDVMHGRTWLLALGLVAAAPVVGQAAPDAQKQQERAGKRAAWLRDKVGLDEHAAGRVEAILDAHRDARRAAHQELRQARQQLHGLVESNSGDDAAYAR